MPAPPPANHDCVCQLVLDDLDEHFRRVATSAHRCDFRRTALLGVTDSLQGITFTDAKLVGQPPKDRLRSRPLVSLPQRNFIFMVNHVLATSDEVTRC